MLDFDVKGGKVADFRYKLLPVFSNLIAADTEMAALIEKVRAPYKDKLEEKLAVTEGTLYRRGNFNGTLDQLILDALMEVKGADAAFSPGFRWGTSILPGQAITFEARDGSDRDHLSADHAHRDDRRDRSRPSSKTSATTCSIPTPTTSRAATWCASAAFSYTCDPSARNRQPHPGHAP